MLRRNKLSSASLKDLESNNQQLFEKDNKKINNSMKAIDIPTPPRSESMAYEAHSSMGTLWSKFEYYARANTKAVLGGIGLLLLMVILITDSSDSPGSSLTMIRGGSSLNYARDHWGGAVHPGYFDVNDSIIDDHTFHFAAVTDLDKLSEVKDSSKPLFRSTLLPGILTRDDNTNKYTIKFEQFRTMVSAHNEAGRGMELSELTIYKNRLLSFDDRTGTVYELLTSEDAKDTFAVPRFVITEGDGDTDKGMKWEWATIKNNELILGSMGKEFTNNKGEIENTNNLWVAVLNERGELRREDWKPKFDFVRSLVGALPPGYIIMEAILWSDHLKKWVFLPRRISSTMYDEVEDERKGSTKVVMVNDKFTEGEVVDIKMIKKDMDPLHGFSTFAFVPGTGDQHAIAVRSVEEDCTGALEDCKQRSYITVFNVLTGEVLMDEVKIEMAEKFEGIEFVNVYTPPPKW